MQIDKLQKNCNLKGLEKLKGGSDRGQVNRSFDYERHKEEMLQRFNETKVGDTKTPTTDQHEEESEDRSLSRDKFLPKKFYSGHSSSFMAVSRERTTAYYVSRDFQKLIYSTLN